MKYILTLLLITSLFSSEAFELISKAYKYGLKPIPNSYKLFLSEVGLAYQDLSEEKILLGKRLFFEKELSIDKDISCASCHSFEKGGADGVPTAIGHNKQKNPYYLNTPTVFNTAFSKKFFWNGGANTLKEQAKGPLQAPFEMGITPKLAEKRISSKKPYKILFKNAFRSDEVTFEKIVEAIATYEKTLVTKGRYDEFLTGKADALTKDEKEGLDLFITKGCVGCHNGIGLGGQELRRFPLTYHNIWSVVSYQKADEIKKEYLDVLNSLKMTALNSDTQKIEYIKNSIGVDKFTLLAQGYFYNIDINEKSNIIISTACDTCHIKNSTDIKSSLASKISFPFENKGGFLGARGKEKYFRVPLLRNVVQTKPYFHNGSIDNLEDAITLMGIHQTRNSLTQEEIKKIVAFLKSVDGELVEYAK